MGRYITVRAGLEGEAGGGKWCLYLQLSQSRMKSLPKPNMRLSESEMFWPPSGNLRRISVLAMIHIFLIRKGET